MDKTILAAVLVAIGALLGFLSSFALARTQHRHALTLRIAEEYFAARRDLVDVVSELTDLKLRDELPNVNRIRYRDAVAKIFYKNFDLLPKQVLEAITLLHVSLEHPALGPFALQNGTVVRMASDQVAPFVERCNMFANAKFIAAMALNSNNSTIRTNQIIKLHARHVLHVLSKFSSVAELAAISDRMHKASSR